MNQIDFAFKKFIHDFIQIFKFISQIKFIEVFCVTPNKNKMMKINADDKRFISNWESQRDAINFLSQIALKLHPRG